MSLAQVNDEPKDLRIDEAAERFRVSRAFLYSKAKDGRFPIRKLGGRSLILVADIERLLAVPSGAEWRSRCRS